MTGGNSENRQENEFSQLALKDYRDAILRRQRLFWGVAIFLLVDAVMFFAGLIWASYMIAFKKCDWHLYASALLPGALGAVIAVMALKAVYRVPREEGVQNDDLAPGQGVLKGFVGDLSGD